MLYPQFMPLSDSPTHLEKFYTHVVVNYFKARFIAERLLCGLSLSGTDQNFRI